MRPDEFQVNNQQKRVKRREAAEIGCVGIGKITEIDKSIPLEKIMGVRAVFPVVIGSGPVEMRERDPQTPGREE